MEPYLLDLFVASAHEQRLHAPRWLIHTYLRVFGPPLMKPLRVDMAMRVANRRDWQETRVLDLGCGIGDLSFELAARGADVVGIELDPVKVRSARVVAERWGFRRTRFLAADARRVVSLGLGQFDVIFCLAVLEHIEEDLSVLRQIRGLLRPWGMFVLQVPNARRHVIAAVEEHDGHARPGYRLEEVGPLLAMVGLRVVDSQSIDPLGLNYYWWRCSIPGSRQDRWLYTALAPVFQCLIRLSSLILHGTGSELCFLAMRDDADDVDEHAHEGQPS